MQVITGLAVVGAVPLTVGVVGWITGFCMGMVDHGRWHAWAQTGQALMLAGLACGLVLLILAVLWRGRPPLPGYPGPAAVVEPDLTPLALPEHQQYFAGPPPEPLYPVEQYPPRGYLSAPPPAQYPPGQYQSLDPGLSPDTTPGFRPQQPFAALPRYPEQPRQRAYPAPPEPLSTDSADHQWSR
jgi:hypothetical protein